MRQLSFRSLSTDAESTFHFCIGTTAQFSLAQHRCRVNFSLLRRCDSSVFARSTPMQSQLFTFASVRQLNSRSLNTDAESTFHFCVGATAQFSLTQHRCRVNFSLLRRCDASVFARSTPMQNQLFTFASVPAIQSHRQLQPSPKISTTKQPPPLLTKHFEQGRRGGICFEWSRNPKSPTAPQSLHTLRPREKHKPTHALDAA